MNQAIKTQATNTVKALSIAIGTALKVGATLTTLQTTRDLRDALAAAVRSNNETVCRNLIASAQHTVAL